MPEEVRRLIQEYEEGQISRPELADAAKAKDPAIDVNVKALGDACGSCHKAFRAEKYPGE